MPDREALGRLVREVWVEWASEQPDPKPSWLLPWEDLDDGQREVDMRIGETIAAGEAVDRMAEELVNETRIRSMDFRNGMNMDLEPSRTLVANWVGAARTMLDNAQNYVEMTISLAGEVEGYTFRLERREGKTPHQLREEAEARADAAEAELAALRAQIGESGTGVAEGIVAGSAGEAGSPATKCDIAATPGSESTP